MKEVELILKRILDRSKTILKLRRENEADRELLAEYEGRKGDKCEAKAE